MITARVSRLNDRFERGTYQEAIGQPPIQEEHKVVTDADHLGVGVGAELVPKRSRGRRVGGTTSMIGSSSINVGHGLDMEVRRSEYRDKREHAHSVGHEPPLNTLPRAIDRPAQCHHTSKE